MTHSHEEPAADAPQAAPAPVDRYAADAARNPMRAAAAAEGGPVFKWSYRRLRAARDVLAVLRIIGGPLLASLIAVALFSLPPQIHDYYRTTLQNFGPPSVEITGAALGAAGTLISDLQAPRASSRDMRTLLNVEYWFALLPFFFTVFGLALMVWALARNTRYAIRRLPFMATPTRGFARWLLRNAPLLLALGPVLALLLAAYGALEDAPSAADAARAYLRDHGDPLNLLLNEENLKLQLLFPLLGLLGFAASIATLWRLVADLSTRWPARKPGIAPFGDYAVGRLSISLALYLLITAPLAAALLLSALPFAHVAATIAGAALTFLGLLIAFMAALADAPKRAGVWRFLRRGGLVFLALPALITVFVGLITERGGGLNAYDLALVATLAAVLLLMLLHAICWALSAAHYAAGETRPAVDRLRAAYQDPASLDPIETAPRHKGRAAWLLLLLLALIGALCAAPLMVHTVVLQGIGLLGVATLFVTALSFLTTQVGVFGARNGVPAVLAVFALAVLFSAVESNDNHLLRRLPANAAAVPPPAALCDGASWTTPSDAAQTVINSVRTREAEGGAAAAAPPCDARLAFTAWLESRGRKPRDPTRPWVRPEPFPVFLTAAQGGGLYAATHTAMALTQIQRHCPAFANHLFAISGASGGSVGAALYAALTRRHLASADPEALRCIENLDSTSPRNEPIRPGRGESIPNYEVERWDDDDGGRMRNLAIRALAQDLLTPLGAYALFPDSLQRFTPVAAPSLSRAVGLERALEDSWTVAHNEGFWDDEDARRDSIASCGAPRELEPTGCAANWIKRGFLDLWSPDGLTPALLLNTTEVATGRRRVIAPFTFQRPSEGVDLRFMPLSPEADMPLSTAAMLSARFPWVTPAGWFYRDRREDSGAAARIAECPGSPHCQKMRLADGGYFDNSGVATLMDLLLHLEPVAERYNVKFHIISLIWEDYPVNAPGGFGELLSPVRALQSAREGRTKLEVAAAERTLEQLGVGAKVHRIPIGPLLSPELPLGWTLSRFLREQIATMAGDPHRCPLRGADPSDADRAAAAANRIGRADCAQLDIYQALSAYGSNAPQ